jgi:hypothetical protein
MSDLEKRYNAHALAKPGDTYGISLYTDDPLDIKRWDEMYEGGVQWVNEGYANEEYVSGTATQIEGTIYTRRTTREVPREEWQRLVRIEEAVNLIEQALGQAIPDEQPSPGMRDQHRARQQRRQKIYELAEELVS